MEIIDNQNPEREKENESEKQKEKKRKKETKSTEMVENRVWVSTKQINVCLISKRPHVPRNSD